MKILLAVFTILLASVCLPTGHAETAAGHDTADDAAAPTVIEAPAPTPLPLPVEPLAAPVGSEMRFVALARIRFVHNKWELDPAALAALDTAVNYLALHRGASRLLIRGHADEVGGMAFNDTLSDKRAAAVRDYLAEKGIGVDLIRAEGHGEHAPADENWTRLGRARNRHVELFAVYPPPAPAP